MDHIFNGTFSVDRQGVRWIPEAGDGVFSIFEGGYIKLVDLKTNRTENLVARSDVKDEHGRQLGWSEWRVSADMQYMLIKTNYRKQWRHSSLGNYYLHSIRDKTTVPLHTPSNPPVTSYATFSPSGLSIAYVSSNDIYIIPSLSALFTSSSSSLPAPIRLTFTGNETLIHGVPDWVYEEEVYGADHTLWWSPDSNSLAYLSFDETDVDVFSFPIYNPTEDSYKVVPYTQDVKVKYPKPGYKNPLVNIRVFELDKYLDGEFDEEDRTRPAAVSSLTLTLDWSDRQRPQDSIVQEVAWIANQTLLVKEVNRAADRGSVVLFDLSQSARANIGKVVRTLGKDSEEWDGGWIDSAQNIYPLSSNLGPGGSGAPAYLDIVPDAKGYNHIALFSPADSSKPVFLTTGEWEVTGNILGVDKNGTIYFQAARPSTDRHISAVQLPSSVASHKAGAPTDLTDLSVPAYYDAHFSPNAGFYLLSYQGPGIPWQKILQVSNESFNYVLTDNAQLNRTYEQYESPIISHSTIDSDGYELNVLEMRPPKMDDSGRTKYPVLFRVYGGPGSQMVSNRFERDWHHYVVCGLKYIVVVVDGRGTGFKGRKLRNPVRENLGFWETKDQINAARTWAAKAYVDPKRIGIWGWSYGGFMSSKVAEANAGIHSLAMAVAPVTSWRLYDSIYTERYMNLPDLNPEGYVNASISNVTGFHNVDFLLAHGSGDDNVHFANSAHLLDMFTRAQVRDFRFRMFTDSDHGINRRGAYRELFEWMTAFLLEKWGKGGRRRSW
ncbi:hypothetical protein GLOTRDRAFT_59312 [Gloeophyllum trabeum ATCC 11539]|uniref:Dipeptidyl aminopeptidase n=1 Tax=Gloeophyllum trabeum (strain ATCC 11539 / FP-39264 / Madison 617) TaxID=670483 RepID=S7Q9K2_GLOTA|nr:uncharacterized protein GLOTRDRAFT_59312 [Gloeophyllum trabeum ATCC 11539]EPQ56197.1 hypothetical protein GLOTRDRAFT_59312 [Gloeophyllum trabeum ATCC 11539]